MITPIRRQHGITLVEACVCTAITAVLAGVGAGSFQTLREHRQIEGAAAQFETDLMHARSLAVLHNVPVRVGFKARADGSCYVVHTGAADDCDCDAAGNTVCSAGALSLRGAGFAAGSAPTLRSTSASILIEPTRGTVTPTTTLKVSGASGAAVHRVVNIMGRVRSCSPGRAVPGYPAC